MFKDLPEGQTHSYNDGCGEKAHNKKKAVKDQREMDEGIKEKITEIIKFEVALPYSDLNLICEMKIPNELLEAHKVPEVFLENIVKKTINDFMIRLIGVGYGNLIK